MFTTHLRTAAQFANNVTEVTMNLAGFNQNEYERCQKVRAARMAPAINYYKKSRKCNQRWMGSSPGTGRASATAG